MANNSPIMKIKGIGEKTAALFEKLGLKTVDDLVHYYPRAYDRYEEMTDITHAVFNARNSIYATVKSNPRITKYGAKSVVSFVIGDGNASCEVRFFNANYMLKAVSAGEKRVFRGVLKSFRSKVYLDQPKIYTTEEYLKLQGTIVPIYSLTKDLTNERVKKTVAEGLKDYWFDKDYLTDNEIKTLELTDNKSAVIDIHFPKNEEAQYYARRRIVFDEFLSFVALSKEARGEAYNLPNSYKMIEVADCKRLEEALPYKLTNAQKRAISEIFEDMSSDYLMNRLVQGDVGSGKTIVSIMALLMCVANGYQGAMMAPTEVLARQHYENIKSLSERYGLCINPCLLVGKMSAKDKREILEGIKTGEFNVILGTHAIIQENVTFKNLALVITDEQHRFGVRQRETLRDKGLNPHILVMSATPIPRTLAMVVFGGIAVSVIDELPKNRIPIATCVVNSSYRIKAYEKIQSEIDAGHQAYVICPMVFENDENVLCLKSVEEHARELKEYFGDKVRIGTLNGKMKADEKTRIMEDFKEHRFDILVSTTVIEVGIDVPNATVIMIENSERFGLSQLHQLRGRVGRGAYQSYCILMSDVAKPEIIKRLKVLNSTNDGFKIASEDMKLRGPGELNGVMQSGELSFGLGDVENDSDLLMLAVNWYDTLKDRMPNLNNKIIDFRTI